MCISDILKEINHDFQNKNFTKSNFVVSGFKSLDEIIQGFSKSDFVIIGARSDVGKTSFVLNIANNLCLKQKIGALDFYT
ncbi:DnaB-like helicase C-terminal domain-containing protein [Borreliella tanukii]|uniref:DnaB-like helicase C-terminal domain-containing protein n=1 Tax=Borreliella tanukii TaxID=56146 RepID=UPI003AB97DA6